MPKTVQPLADNKALQLTVQTAADLPTGQGAAARLRQVLLNIVGNAVKFTDQGAISVGASQSDGMFRIVVADTGPGIAEVEQEAVFDEFRQADDTSTRVVGGTGLGLAISRKLARLHGGDVTLESVLGEGSIFTVTLPVDASSSGEMS